MDRASVQDAHDGWHRAQSPVALRYSSRLHGWQIRSGAANAVVAGGQVPTHAPVLASRKNGDSQAVQRAGEDDREHAEQPAGQGRQLLLSAKEKEKKKIG